MADKPIDTRGQKLYSLDSVIFPEQFKDDVEGILIPEPIVRMRAQKMLENMRADFHDKYPVVVPLMDGADPFYHILFSNRRDTFPMTTQRLTVKSYEGTESTGDIFFPNNNEWVRLLRAIHGNDRPLLLIEDIVDSGTTIGSLRKRLMGEGIAEDRISLAALVSKHARRLSHFDEMWIHYLGFIIDDYFIVGCGLDFEERYRELPDICVLKPHVYNGIMKAKE